MKRKANQSHQPPLHEAPDLEQAQQTKGTTSRRALLRTGLAVGGVGAISAGLFNASVLNARPVFARASSASPTSGDLAILQFLAALEIIESDLWRQYNELGGIQDHEVPGGSGIPSYTAALVQLDMDMPQYIHDNTDDEISHFTFINAYLASKGVKPISLDRFRTLPGSEATGARHVKRITNLMQLTVDTTWWTRYRSSSKNPDFGDTFAPAIPGLSAGKFPAIPRNDNDLKDPHHLQAIANTAGFHFGFIEQGGSSLYPSLAQRVTNAEVLRVLLSIGPTETMHFQTWQDKAGTAPAVTDPTNGLTFPDLTHAGESLQANLIMPEPTIFLDRKFPRVSIIRPTETEGAAMGAVNAFIADGLFIGQSDEFFRTLHDLAAAADSAERQL